MANARRQLDLELLQKKHWWLVCVSSVTCRPSSSSYAPQNKGPQNLQDDDTLLQNVDTLLQEELLQLQCLIFSRNRPDPSKRPDAHAKSNKLKSPGYVTNIFKFYVAAGPLNGTLLSWKETKTIKNEGRLSAFQAWIVANYWCRRENSRRWIWFECTQVRSVLIAEFLVISSMYDFA